MFSQEFFVYLFKSQIQKLKFRKFFTFFLIIFLTLPFVYGLDSIYKKIKEQISQEEKLQKIYKILGIKIFQMISNLSLVKVGYTVDGMVEICPII